MSATHYPGAPRVLALGILLMTLVVGFSPLPPTARADHETLDWDYFGIASYAAGFDRSHATVFADDAGSVYVFYTTKHRASGVVNLNVTKFSTGGFAHSPVKVFDVQVNTAPEGRNSVFEGIAPSVAIDATGALYVAYSETRSGADLSKEVYVSKSVDRGATWLPEVRANDAAAAGEDGHPSIAVAPNGNIFVAWRQEWGSAREVTASVSTNGGLSFGNVQNISGPWPSSASTAVSVTTDSADRTYVVYDDIDFAQGHFVVNFTWSDDGVNWSAPRTLSGPDANLFLPTIKADERDRLHAAWIDSGGNDFFMWYTRSEDRGANWTAPVRISRNAAQPTVVGARTSIGISGGTLMVAWTASQGGTSGLAYAISPDQGDSWHDERFFAVPSFPNAGDAVIDADENGTFYAAPSQTLGSPSPTAVFLEYWYGPPSPPTVTLSPSGIGELEVRWTDAPEHNVVGYRVWHSLDAVNYQMIAAPGAASRNHTDQGLSNGTHWYYVQAVNDRGLSSHPSVPVRGMAATTEEDLVAVLQAEIAALQAKLAALNDTSSAEAEALREEIARLEAQLNALRTEEPPLPWTSNINNIVSIVTIALLAIVLVLQFRRRRPQPPPAAVPEPLPPEEPSEAQLEEEFEELERELEEFPELEEEAPLEPSVPEFEDEERER